MRYSKRSTEPGPPAPVRLRFWGALMAATLVAVGGCRLGPDSAGGSLAVVEMEVLSGQDSSRLRAALDHRLSDPVREALHNGVSLTFVWELELLATRDWLWDPTVWSAAGRRQVSYRSLSARYTVIDDDGSATSYPDVERTLAALATLDVGLALSRAELESVGRPYFRFRTRLDTAALPPPLRLPSYISAAWRLDSGWQALEPGVVIRPGSL